MSLTKWLGFCLSSYMLLVIPVVAMLMGRGLLDPGADLILTPEIVRELAAPPLMALPGRPALAVLFSRDRPRIERVGLVGT